MAKAKQLQQALRLRLAAMAGHLLTDRVAARRAALVDVLLDRRPHTREVLWEAVAARVGESVADCWGKVPREAPARDLAVLRQGGLRIGCARRPGIEGCCLQYPPLTRQAPQRYEEINWELIAELRKLPVPERLERTFAAAEFALQQKRLTLAGEHPEWPAARVEREARRIVYGVALLPAAEATTRIAGRLRARAAEAADEHLEAVACLVRLQADRLDGAELEAIAAGLGLLGEWRQVWAESGMGQPHLPAHLPGSSEASWKVFASRTIA